MITDNLNLLFVGAADTGDIPSLKSLWQEAFGDSDGFVELFFKTAFSSERCRIIRADGEVAAALYILDCSVGEKKLAYIYAVATMEKYRGKGFCKKLMNDTHMFLAKGGYSAALLVPSEASLFKFYSKIGYSISSEIAEAEVKASGETVALRRIDKKEYAELRKRYLPYNGVVQEGESLDFFESYASFYAGDDFLLAAFADNSRLFGAELLGNASNLGGILKTLECESGVFRMPDGERKRRFSMCISLDGTPLPELYFGLAFD